MARRGNGTLEAKEDDHGVHIRADVSKSVWGRNGHEAIKNKLINKMSFCFDVEQDKWRSDEIEGVKIQTREIIQFAHIYDYSPVSYPAYKQTKVTARTKDLALRHKPEPETPGEGDETPSVNNVGELKDVIEQRQKTNTQIQEEHHGS